MIITEQDLEEEVLEEEEEQELVIFQQTLLDYFREDNSALNEDIILWDSPDWEKNLELFASSKKIAFDVETYGAESWHPLWFKKNKIRLIQVGLSNGKCLIADLGGWKENTDSAYKALMLERYGKFLEILKDKLFDINVVVVGVNLKFDYVTIRQHFGFILRQARDLMILSQVYWAGVGVEKAKAGENRSERCKLSHGLKGIAERFGYDIDKSEQTSNWGWRISNSQLNYAANDVIVVLKIFDDFKPMILEAGLTYTAFVECNCVSVFGEMEFKGVPVNKELAAKELIKYEEKIQSFIDIFEESFPTVQWSSNKQVLEAFQEEIPNFNDIFDKEKDEKPSVSAEVLHQVDHPAAKALLEARRLSTGANNLRGFINNSFDGNIRGFYRQIAPGGSGRSTCSAKMSVNRKSYNIGAQLQNPPNTIKEYKGELKGVREFIEAPPGYKLIVSDAAQAHMRIAAQVSADPLLLKIFNDDFDGHSILAGKLARLSGLPWSADFISGVLYKGPRDETWKVEAQKAYEKRRGYLITDYVSDAECKNNWIKGIEGEAKTFRNVGKTMIYSCVDLGTKCLTRTGWKSHNEVEAGTEILAYNPETEKNEWTPIIEKFFYKDAPVTEWKIGKFKSFKSTPNHRWFGKRRIKKGFKDTNSFTYYKNHWFTTESVTTEDIIINTALAEGSNSFELDYMINKYAEDDKWEQMVLDMSEKERWLFFSANIATDRYITKSDKGIGRYKSAVFTQDITKQAGLYKAMHLCGYLLGYNPVSRPSTVEGNNCWNISFGTRRSTTMQKPQRKDTILPNQDVWCVSTKFETWVVKDEETDYITITGNSLNGSTKGRIYQELISTGYTWATIDDAAALVKFFNESYPNLVKYIKAQYKLANTYNIDFSGINTFDGYPVSGLWGKVTTLTGRILYLKKYPNRFREGQLQVSYTDCTASNWLPVEANLIKHWMVEVYNEFCLHPEWEAYIGNLPHDEGNFICKEEYAPVVAPMIQKKMSEVFNKHITLLPGIDDSDPLDTICNNWSEK